MFLMFDLINPWRSSSKHRRIEMERLPDEIVLLIFSFVPAKHLFLSVSIVCKRFHRLSYDCSTICRSGGLLKEINLQRKSELTVQRMLSVITMLPF